MAPPPRHLSGTERPLAEGQPRGAHSKALEQLQLTVSPGGYRASSTPPADSVMAMKASRYTSDVRLAAQARTAPSCPHSRHVDPGLAVTITRMP